MIGQLLVVGILAALEPLPNIGYILLLQSKNGRRNTNAFLAGWLVCLVAIVAVTLVGTGGNPPAAHSSTNKVLDVVFVLLGLLLLGLGTRRFLQIKRGTVKARKDPRWMQKVDAMGLWSSAGLGVLLQPWPLIAAGAISVADLDGSSLVSLVAIVLFVLLATSALLSMHVYSRLQPERSAAALERLSTWIRGHEAVVMQWVCWVAGVFIIVKNGYPLVA